MQSQQTNKMANFDTMADFLMTCKADTMAKDNEITELKFIINRELQLSDDLKLDNSNKQQIIDTLNGEKTVLKINIEELVNDKYEVVAKLGVVNKKLKESDAIIQSNKAMIDRQNGELKDSDHRIKQLIDENEALKADKVEFETHEKQWKIDKKRMEKEIKIIDDDLNKRKIETRKSDQQLKYWQKTVEALREELNASGVHGMANNIKSLELKVEQLTNAYDEANEKFAQKCDELRKLHNEKTGIEIDYSEVVNERDKYKAQCAEHEKNLLKLEAAANRAIRYLKQSRTYFRMTNERNKRRLLAEKLHSRNHAKLIRKLPEVIDDEQEKIRLDELIKLKNTVNKAIDNSYKRTNKKSKKSKKRVIKQTDAEMNESRKRAKRVTDKLPENRVQCAYCDMNFGDTGNCQRHMTMVHMIAGLARNLDDKSDGGDNPIEVFTIDDSDDGDN